jgi:KDO2-lipid IV(A) lauroyltransferase
VTGLLRLVLRLQALMPLGFSQWLGRGFGSLNYYLGSRSTQVTKQNLQLCLPELSPAEIQKLTYQSMRQTGMTAFETPAVWLSDLSRTSAWIESVENEQLLDDAMASDQGTLVLLPHLGNWEMFNVYFASKGRMTALYQPPRQDWAKPLMAKVRGDNLVPTNRHGLATLYRELKDGQVVTVLPDQVPATGEFAPFFGQPALTDRLVPRMLRKTGARAIICIVYRKSGKFHLRFDEVDNDVYAADLTTALAALNLSVEKSIRKKLVQYQWEYKRFRERPAGAKKLYKFNGQPDLYHQ